jgi:hypothetical protein
VAETARRFEFQRLASMELVSMVQD